MAEHARRLSRRMRLVRSVAVVAALAVATGWTLVATSGSTAPGSAGRAGSGSVRAGSRSTAGGAAHAGTTTTIRGAGGSHPHRPATTAASTSLGPAGIVSSAIVAENRNPGTTAWQISGAPPTGFIEGFAGLNYAAVGQSVALYVSTSAPRFHVVAYRMGWYGGDGGRQVWASSELPGTVQPPCPLTSGVNMVACDNWTVSLQMPVTTAFVQGDYLLKLTGSDGEQAYVLLTVWDPTSTAAYLVMARTMTEAAWNTYGGYSFYQGNGPCPAGSNSYPVCNRARIASLDRPFSTGDGASDFLTNEFPLVQFLEKNGLDVAYVTDITVDQHPGIVLDHRALFSLGHDEVWSYNEREAAETGLAQGVNVVFFGAAAVLRHCRLQASPLGPDREVVDYRDETEDPLNGNGDPMEVTGNTWSSPPTSWPETSFVGQIYSGYMDPGTSPVPLVVEDGSAWIFKGTGLQTGSEVPGVVDSDIDHVAPGAGTPSNTEVLGHSPVPLSETYTNQGEWGADTYSDMTYFTDPTSEGGVFDSGTVNWIFAMNPCPGPTAGCPSPALDEITANLLWLFGQGPAGRLDPSVSNLQSVVPAGS